MGKIRERMNKRRLKRTLKRIRNVTDKIPIDVGEQMPNADPMKKPQTMTLSKGGSIRARLSSGGPVGKPN